MGLPEVIIDFEKNASTAITRSERGIVAIIIKDATVDGVYTYAKYKNVKQTYDTDNLALIERAFTDGVYKLVVCAIAETGTIAEALALLTTTKFNYLACPFAVTEDNTTIATWIKTRRSDNKKFKAVLVKHVGDDEALTNFTTDGIKVKGVSTTSGDFAVRIAVALAITPLNQSATYHVFDDVTAINSKTDEDDCIDKGELILTNDGEKIKIARAVNSLTTLGEDKTESMKKIKIIEGMDLISTDIYTNFKDNYIGKEVNDYNSKSIFISANNAYFKNLEKQGVLDPDYENLIEINIEKHEEFIIAKGIDIDTLNDEQIKRYNTGTKMFLKANVQFLDAMEDLYLNIGMEG